MYFILFHPLDGLIKTFYSSSPSRGPLITGSIPATSSLLYNVQVELMLTDLDRDNEYADITLNGISFGQCNPSSCQACCKWYNCSALRTSPILGSPTGILVHIQYSNSASSYRCTVNGHRDTAIARITLVPLGWLIVYCL